MERELINIKEVMEIAPIKKTTIYKLMKCREFPKCVKIGRKSFWRIKEIKQWYRTQSYDLKEVKKYIPEGWINIDDKKPPKRKILQFLWNGKSYAGWYDADRNSFWRFTLKSRPGEENELITSRVQFWAYLMKPPKE